MQQIMHLLLSNGKREREQSSSCVGNCDLLDLHIVRDVVEPRAFRFRTHIWHIGVNSNLRLRTRSSIVTELVANHRLYAQVLRPQPASVQRCRQNL